MTETPEAAKAKRFIFLDLLSEGGDWLGAVRSQIQSMFRNGSSVTWGSFDVLEPHAHVRDIEELCSVAACVERNKIQAAIDEATEGLKKEIAMLRAMNPNMGTFPPLPKTIPTFTSTHTVTGQENTNGE